MSALLQLHPRHPMRGRGMFVWNAGSNDPDALCKLLSHSDFRWLAIKSQEGTRAYQPAGVRAYREACRRHGLELLLWGYLYGVEPEAEANLALALARRYEAPGFIADCEVEYESSPAGRSERLAHALNHGNPHLALALSSFGRIDLHRGLDWHAFERNRFCFMPQAYECESRELTPSACVKAAHRVWQHGMILPTLGTYRGANGQLPGARLAQSIEGLGLRGFQVWAAHTTMPAQLHALGRA